MRKAANIVISIIVLLSAGFAYGQAPNVLWYSTFGGYYTDETVSIARATNDDLLLAGYSYSLIDGGFDAYLVRTNSEGDLISQSYIGSHSDDWANCIQPTTDGGFIVAGGTESFGVDESDIYLFKLDSEGQIQWQRTYGGEYSEQADYVMQTDDGGYFLVGWTNSLGGGYDDIYILRTNSVGDSLWAKTFGGQFYDKAYSAVQTSEGDFVIIGGIGYFGYNPIQAYLIKVNDNGDSLWAREIGGTLSDAGRSIAETPDSGFIFTGWTMSYGAGEHDVYLVKTDADGEPLWYNTFGGSDTDVGRFISPTTDGGYLITGYTQSFGNGSQNVYIVKVNSDGDSLWATAFGGDEDDYGWAGIEDIDGGYLVTGWTRSYSPRSKDALLMKLESDHNTIIDGAVDLLPIVTDLRQNYPNPFNASTTISYSTQETQHITLAVFDLLGREILTLVDQTVEPGTHDVVFDASSLTSGVYLCALRAGNNYHTRRMVLIK
jgi:hypothetical protein